MRVDWQRLASVLFCALVAVGAFFLIGKYVIAVVMPFVIAWIIAMAIRRPAEGLAKRLRMPRRLAAVLLLLLLFALLGTLLTLGIGRLVRELGRLVERFTSGDVTVGEQVSRLLEQVHRVSDRIPFLADSDRSGLQTSVDNMIASLLRQAFSALTSTLTSLVGTIIGALPSIGLFLVVTIIATFYFALDLDAIHRGIGTLLPARVASRIPATWERTRRFLLRYSKAYLFLMFITFCELFGGFTILGIEYAFVLALAISAVDILPVLGVGTVLVPWSVIMLLLRDFRVGFGLLILWAVATVVRQVIEPHIVGGTLGLHPVLTLAGMYVGLRLFGLVGMLLAPALILAVKTALREWRPTVVEGTDV